MSGKPGLSVAVILNPRSAAGRTARRWPRLEARLRERCGDLAIFRTAGPGHATELTRGALREGYGRILSVGGDGTHFEVVNGFFAGGVPVNPDAVLAILPCGTASDLAKTLRIPRGEAAVDVACGDQKINCDVGRAVHASREGGTATTYFLNTCHIGIGSEVAARVNERTKRAGGFAAFLWGTLRALRAYQDQPMRIGLDGEFFECMVKELIVAKGQYDGGGMHVAPFAQLDNGLFDVYMVGPVSFGQALVRLPKLYQGRLHECTGFVRYQRARVVEIQGDGCIPLSPDGEVVGALPARLDLLPGVLRLTGAPVYAVGNLSRPEVDIG